ncbi:uncharacterized protein WCC33_004168 [Rhinophrynus dorsalis]
MSQSMMRKAQPFTIGTRLSLPKCPDFSTSTSCVGPLDNDAVPQNLNDRVSQYLAQACPSTRSYSPPQRGAIHSCSPTGGISDEHQSSCSYLARSIKKITLSSQGESPRTERPVRLSPRVLTLNAQGNFNNNNSRTLRDPLPNIIGTPFSRAPRGPVPRLIGVDYSKTATAQVKVGVGNTGADGAEQRVTQRSEEETDTVPAQSLTTQGHRSASPVLHGERVKTPPSGGGAVYEGRTPLLDGGTAHFAQLSRDIIQMLDVSVSQVSSLHPVLASRANHKQRQVKDCWAQLQQSIRTEKTVRPILSSTFTRELDNPLTPGVLQQSSVGIQRQRILGGPEATVQTGHVQGGGISEMTKGNLQWSPISEDISARPTEARRKNLVEETERPRRACREEEPCPAAPEESWLLDELSSAEHWLQSLEGLLSEPAAMQSPEVIRRDLRKVSAMEKEVKSRGLALHSLWNKTKGPGNPELSMSEDTRGRVQDVEERFQMALEALRRRASDLRDTLVLSEFMEIVKMEEDRRKQEALTQRDTPPAVHPPIFCLEKITAILQEDAAALKDQSDKFLDYLLKLNFVATGAALHSIFASAWISRAWGEQLSDVIQSDVPNDELLMLLSKILEANAYLREAAFDTISFLEKFLRKMLEDQVWRTMLDLRHEGLRKTFKPPAQGVDQSAVDLLPSPPRARLGVYDSNTEPGTSNSLSAGAGGGSTEGPCDRAVGGDRREVFTPLEELQEAVEMLNDAVKERERTVAFTKQIENMESELSAVSHMIRFALSRLDVLRKETEETERGFVAVKSQTDLKDLQGLIMQQQKLEAEVSGSLRLEVRRLEGQVARLQELCPERMQEMGRDIQETLQAWAQLQDKTRENHSRIQRTAQLRGFFHSYLDMISWTEDTRAQIFVESPGESLPVAWREELERRIEGKLKEFEELASVGWRFIGEEHFLTQTIKERLEELQGMLSWVLMRWRCQKKQRILGNKTDRRRIREAVDPSHRAQENPPGPDAQRVPSFLPGALQIPQENPPGPDAQRVPSIPPEALDILPSKSSASPPARGPTLRRYERRTHSPMSLQQHLARLSAARERDGHLGAELLEDSNGLKCSEGPVWLKPRELPRAQETAEEQEPSYTLPPPKPPGTFWRRCQGLIESTFGSLKRRKRVSLPSVEEVSSFLHVKDSEQPRPVACQSLTVPRPSKKSHVRDHYSLPCKSKTVAPTITFPKIRSHSLFNSLKRKEKAQRCTVQGIMGLYSDEVKSMSGEPNIYQTHTWPPKQLRKVPVLAPSQNYGKFTNYVKNPLARDIDTECGTSGSLLKKAEIVSKSLKLGTPESSVSCRRLPLGSVLSLELPKEPSLLHNIQETITVARKEPNTSDYNCYTSISDSVHLKRTDQSQINILEMSEEKHCQASKQETYSKCRKSLIEELNSCSSSCRQSLQSYGKSASHLKIQQLEGASEECIDFDIERLSPIGALHEQLEPEWDRLRAALSDLQSNDGSRGNLLAADSENSGSSDRCQTRNVNCSSSILQNAQEMGHYLKTSSNEEQHDDTVVLDDSSLVPINTDDKTPRKLRELSICKLYNDQKGPSSNRTFHRSGSCSLPEVLHPDHEFLDQDDEELEGIWNNAKRRREGGNTQTTSHKVTEGGSLAKNIELEAPGQKSKCRQVVMMTKPNMLVATFTLPTSALEVNNSAKEIVAKEHTERNGHDQARTGDPACRDLTQTRGSEVGSIQSSVDICKEEDGTRSHQEMRTGKLSQKMDFQLMEGPLEKKNTLQQGGKKASCRTWSLYYAVLVRRTLCFYQDRKNSPKSSVSAPPLHLTGATCTPETDYTKRDNCFRLQLADGSEYLLRAPSSPLVHEWVSKIQHNAGLEDADLLRDPLLKSDLSPLRTNRVGSLSSRIPDLCQPVSVHSREVVERMAQRHRDQAEAPDQRTDEQSVPVLRTDRCSVTAAAARPQPSCRLTGESIKALDQCFQEDDLTPGTNRRRSRSFSSVTYQKVTATETSPSYSVTLYIGESTPPRGRCHSFATTLEDSYPELAWGKETSLIEDPKPRKSVFRKFFRKKD